jgi:hypothetical protein
MKITLFVFIVLFYNCGGQSVIDSEKKTNGNNKVEGLFNLDSLISEKINIDKDGIIFNEKTKTLTLNKGVFYLEKAFYSTDDGTSVLDSLNQLLELHSVSDEDGKKKRQSHYFFRKKEQDLYNLIIFVDCDYSTGVCEKSLFLIDIVDKMDIRIKI